MGWGYLRKYGGAENNGGREPEGRQGRRHPFGRRVEPIVQIDPSPVCSNSQEGVYYFKFQG
jgi:hypothetical protein